MPKGVKLGIRVTVAFATPKRSGKKGVSSSGSNRYIYVLKKTADALGLTIVPLASTKTKKGNTVAVRGSHGSGSIKVPVGGAKDGKQKYLSVPVPAGATIKEIQQFLAKAKNKPTSFVSVNGRTYPVATK